MNRRVTLVGLLLLLIAIVLVLSPFALTGTESFNLEFQLGVLSLPIGLTTMLWGAASANPDVTTVGGAFGNPDENVMARMASRSIPEPRVRYASGPRESVNCRHCYTAIPWNLAECPRCGRRRDCRGCGRPLFYLSGAVRCGPCVRDEVYCNCPKTRRGTTTGVPGRGRPR
jgi:hypothetical protein